MATNQEANPNIYETSTVGSNIDDDLEVTTEGDSSKKAKNDSITGNDKE